MKKASAKKTTAKKKVAKKNASGKRNVSSKGKRHTQTSDKAKSVSTSNSGSSSKANSAVDLRTVRLKGVEDLPADFAVHTDVKRWSKLPVRILDKYIFVEIIAPFVVALAFFTMIYMVIALQKMIGLFIGKGIDPWRLLDYFGYLLANTLPMTIPMACLMSGIMAAGRLSGDSEITAMRSAGVSFPRIYANFLGFGLVMALVVGYLNFYLSPENNRKMQEFNNWILTYNPMLAITPGQFSGDKNQDIFETKARTMYSGGMDPESGNLSNVQIREWEIFLEGKVEFADINGDKIPMGGSRMTQIISARKGILVEKKGPTGEYTKSIRLQEGFALEWNEDKQGFTLTNFMDGEMDYNVPKKEEKKTLEINVKPETFSLPMLFKIRDSLESEGLHKIPGLEMLKEMGFEIDGISGLESIIRKLQVEIINGVATKSMSSAELTQRYTLFSQLQSLLRESKKVLTDFNVEIHRRIAMVVSCQIFLFLSFPLGLVAKRSGKGMSFSLAVVFLLIYYLFFILGSTISYKESIPDWIGPWSANIVVAIISVYIMMSRTDIALPKWLENIISWFSEQKSKLTNRINKIKSILNPKKSKNRREK